MGRGLVQGQGKGLLILGGFSKVSLIHIPILVVLGLVEWCGDSRHVSGAVSYVGESNMIASCELPGGRKFHPGSKRKGSRI